MHTEYSIAKNTDADLWNTIVNSSSHATLFHNWNWLKIVEKHTGMKFYPLIIYHGMEPVGLVPLFYQSKLFHRLVFSPPPKSGIAMLGPVVNNYENLKQNKKEQQLIELQKQTDEFIQKELNANYISISMPHGLLDPRPLEWAGYKISPVFDYATNLCQGSDQLWLELTHNARRQIKHAKKVGITVREGQRNDLDKMFNLMDKRYEEQNMVSPITKQYLFEIYDMFKNNLTFFLAEYNEEILTGIIHTTFKERIFMWVGNNKSTIDSLPKPNDFVQWESMKYASEHGFKEYIDMGAPTSVVRYKHYNKFNPELHVRFTAKKYTFSAKLLETAYVKLGKPVSSYLTLLKKRTPLP